MTWEQEEMLDDLTLIRSELSQSERTFLDGIDPFRERSCDLMPLEAEYMAFLRELYKETIANAKLRQSR